MQLPRSSGSILKPFLHAALLDDGKMLPHTLQPDVPTFINGFTP
jgi:penicillin-binding protein 1C